MFDIDDILIVGDSFVSARTNDTDWPKILTEKLSGNNSAVPHGRGFDGCSWWSVRKYLLEQLKHKKPKLLIMSHTEPMRLPHDEDMPINSFNILHQHTFRHQDGEEGMPEIREAARQYYKYLQSFDFHLWAEKQWFKELDKLILELDIPYVVHLHAFLPWYETFVFSKGITFTTPLWELSDDIKQWSVDHRNHFTKINNIKLANFMFNEISNYSDGPREIHI
jgi:hypothetical protein